MLNEDQIPEGYMQNAQGCLVPRANIRPIDIERDALVKEKMEKIKALQAEMRAVKASLLSDVDAFVQLSGERYGVRLGGVKGNVQLLSFDGKYKLCRDYGQLLAFDEGLQAAKELIDGCLRRWCADSRPELRAVVEQAFKVDKKGRINTGAVLGLRRIEIDDPTGGKPCGRSPKACKYWTAACMSVRMSGMLPARTSRSASTLRTCEVGYGDGIKEGC